MRSSFEELSEENRVLRERVAQLESELHTRTDPILAALIENAPNYLNVVTPEGRFLATGRTNEAFGSVVGRSVFEFTNRESHAVLRDAFARAVSTRQPVVYEVLGYGENGEPDHSYIVRVVPLFEGNAVTGLVLVPTDITERVRLERSLVASEARVRLAVEATRIGLWSWDVSTDRIEWDARMLDIFGTQKAPASYAAYQELIHPEDRALLDRGVRHALESGTYPTLEQRLAVRPGEPERWILAVAGVSRDPSGTISHLIGGVLDITDHKRLKGQVERAERAETIGQLTAGIAHNFNNLLATILPNVELALSSASGADHAALSAAIDASLQARDLVRSLLARSGRGANLVDRRTDAKEAVQRVTSMCRMTFPREIQLVTRIAPDVGSVSIAGTDLEQVLLNLLLNARDALALVAAHTRRIDVVVDRVVSEREGPVVRFKLSDTGVGMTDTVRHRIFEPFFSTKDRSKSSGLGLSNALARIREANGTLECESTPGTGTTFTLKLSELGDSPDVRAHGEPAPATDAETTILIVDDDGLVRSMLRRILVSRRYDVIEAESAAQARSVVEREGPRIGLIILDHSMPNESGIEALSSLRARSSAPIVLFTGLSVDVPREVAALLEKPARPSEVYRIVREVLERARA